MGCCYEGGHEELGGEEGPDYVNAEVDLVALGCFGGSVFAHGLDAGVVEEDVELARRTP